MCKHECWALPLSDAALLPMSMATAARRLQNSICNHLLCLQMYLITNHTRSSASSHVGIQAAVSCVHPSPLGLWKFGAFGASEMGNDKGHLPKYCSSLFCCCRSKWWTPTVYDCLTSTMGWPVGSSSCCRSFRSWLAWTEPLEQLQTSVLPGTMSPFFLDLQD